MKRKYEPPVIVNCSGALQESARLANCRSGGVASQTCWVGGQAGTSCTSGTTPGLNACRSGGVAIGRCVVGSVAGTRCTPGQVATVCVTGNTVG